MKNDAALIKRYQTLVNARFSPYKIILLQSGEVKLYKKGKLRNTNNDFDEGLRLVPFYFNATVVSYNVGEHPYIKEVVLTTSTRTKLDQLKPQLIEEAKKLYDASNKSHYKNTAYIISFSNRKIPQEVESEEVMKILDLIKIDEKQKVTF